MNKFQCPLFFWSKNSHLKSFHLLLFDKKANLKKKNKASKNPI